MSKLEEWAARVGVPADKAVALLAEAKADGWKMSPCYASNEMVIAALDRSIGTGTMYHDIWAAMHDAAPDVTEEP